ncbi:MAG: hypothetical protein HS117_06690 [Verrucomicrobiaceae bacterium]|nr:hypothetical protein [Verrucomicrobiaceae bacterium]
MKKITVGLAIFMLLIGYIGWELASTDVAPSSNMWRAREAVQPTQTASEGADITDGDLTAGNKGSIPNAPGVAASASTDHGSQAFQSDAATARAAKLSSSAIKSTGAAIYVFHSKTIVATEKPTESEKSRLQHAIGLATETLRQPIVVLDADALSLSGVPYVLFAKDRFDLTEAIKASYLRLNQTSSTTKVITQSQQQ